MTALTVNTTYKGCPVQVAFAKFGDEYRNYNLGIGVRPYNGRWYSSAPGSQNPNRQWLFDTAQDAAENAVAERHAPDYYLGHGY
jgi:hypothetical protein